MTGLAALVPPAAPNDGIWAPWLEWANALPNMIGFGLKCVEASAGRTLVTLTKSALAVNPNGAVNGGLVVAAADQCMGLVALTTLPPGDLPATATLHAEFLRPAFAPLELCATVAQQGRRLVFVAVDVTDAQGRLCVRCTGTMATQSAGRGSHGHRHDPA